MLVLEREVDAIRWVVMSKSTFVGGIDIDVHLWLAVGPKGEERSVGLGDERPF